MNPDLNKLQPYPFAKLNALKASVTPPKNLTPILLSIGEPKHSSPTFVTKTLQNNLDKLANYPLTKGSPELRQAIAQWATKRFKLNRESLSPETNVLPVSGTREALFAFTQATIDRDKKPLVISPNPFYQIYEGAALLAGAEPHYLPCQAENHFIPNFEAVSESTWQRCQLLFLCSPGNPTGAVADRETLKKLIALADKYDFVIASDECYSEIYFDEKNAPVGLLQVCSELGRNDYHRCVVFHSLSKRSNLPGLRSGFVAGDASLLEPFLLYRTYQGCAMPIQHQLASIAAWNDEDHVIENRRFYREKFNAVLNILGDCMDVEKPDASFYLWAGTPIDDQEFAGQLLEQQNVTVLPGSYLAREVDGINPGANRIRMALVAPIEECVEAAQRIKLFLESL